MDNLDDAFSDLPAPDWVKIRAEYEERDGTEEDICTRHGITPARMRYRRETEHWTPRRPRRVRRGALIERMLTVLDKQVRILEKQVPEQVDKGAMLLSTMAKTLEKLTELDKAERASQPTQKKDIRDLRDKVARRIEQLKRG